MDFEILVNTEIIKTDHSSLVRSLLYQFTRDVSSKPFKLQITDPEDPLFLFDYDLTSIKYQEVKREQFLACDFLDFPQCFYELLSINNQEPNTRKAVIDENNKPVLMLQQNTNFRLLVHLQLQLNMASDSRLKEFLSREAKKYKKMYNEALKSTEEANKLRQSEKEKYESQIAQYEQKIQSEQKKFETEKQQIEVSTKQKIQQYEAALIETKQTLGQGYSTREQNIIDKYEEKIEEMRQNNISLIQEKHNAELVSQRHYEKIQNLEQKVTELTQKIKSLEENNQSNTGRISDQLNEISSLRTEVQRYKDKLSFVQQTLEEKATMVNSKASTVEELQIEISSKNEELEKCSKELERLYKVEEDFGFVKKKSLYVFSNLNQKMKDLKVICANKESMIAKMDQEIKKMQYQNHYLAEQLNSASSELNKLREDNQDLRNENTKLQLKVENLTSNLKACEETKNMIEEELNRQHKRTLMEDDDCDLLVSDNEDDINICNNNNINNLRETDNPIKKIGIFSDENTVNYF
ncbi:Spindle assembly abnormal protein 6 [Tritrichomonas musculus]|uniref:Spindle assembly abnormal protein 6 n=1 Tax=Tritrichomonas musculus TaxID=1915356 RepID=A0ABR2IK60_9EUKA